MTPRLGPVLSSEDLPEAELCAARLDGEVLRVDEWYGPADLPVSASARAIAVSRCLPDRLIAEQHTAAWILGMTDAAPTRHQFCATAGARARPANPRGITIREVVIDSTEIVEVAGLKVTSAARTAVDLTRFSDAFGAADQALVVRLLMSASMTIDDCRRLIQNRRKLPGKRRALARVTLLAVTHPVHVVDSIYSANSVEHAIQVRRIAHLENEFAQRKAV